MAPTLYARLWLMVFLQYYVWGTWYVTMGNYLTHSLKFPGEQVGLAYGTVAIGAMISPFFVGIVADRLFATERIFAFLHLLGAALLYVVSTLDDFAAFYPVLIAYTISYMAAHSLTNLLTLHHCTNPARQFPLIMVMGSVGWAAAGIVVSWLKLEDSRVMFQLAAGAAAVLALYGLTLPHTPPKGAGAPISPRVVLGLDALRLLKDRSFATFIICSFLICIPLSFYFSWMDAFMNELQIPHAAAKLTIGQASDVVFLVLLPVMLLQFGVKGILLLGIGAWAFRFGLFSRFSDDPSATWMLYLGIAVHGMCYDFIFVMGRMYVDKWATPDIRGAAQGFHAFVTLGAGMFVGTWLSGAVGQHYKYVASNGSDLHHWQSVWLVPAAMSVVLFLVFALLFKDKLPPTESAADAV